MVRRYLPDKYSRSFILMFTLPQNIDDNKHRFAKHNSLKRTKLQNEHKYIETQKRANNLATTEETLNEF